MIYYLIGAAIAYGAVAIGRAIFETSSVETSADEETQDTDDNDEQIVYRLRYARGKLTVADGKPPMTNRLISSADLLRSAQTPSGAMLSLINDSGRLRLKFSPSIPENIHQQLRNVLLG
jgi:hypothetical protein